MTITDLIISLDALPSLLAACIVLLLGTWLCQRVGFLARYSIPSPVVGGLLFAVAAGLLVKFANIRILMINEVKADLLLIFFASLGLTSDLKLLVRGGRRLLRFLLALIPFLVMQDALGVLIASLLGLHPFLGLVAGSITLVGGHGTGAAYVDKFGAAVSVPGLMGLTMTSATLGLLLGGIVGGPVAERLIRRHRLNPLPDAEDSDVITGPTTTPVSSVSLIRSLTAALVAVLAGVGVGKLLAGAPVTVPDFLLCLLAGLALRNLGGLIGLELHDASSDLLGSVSLSLFLAWTMMALDLAQVLGAAGPLLVILAGQVALVALWASLVTFQIVGRDYESAVMSAAFCGFAMGATATAIANMQALARRHGPAPQAFLIVPIVGAFFIDILNAIVLTVFLSLGFMGLK
ncbi:MAG: sodium/glutamate symporter [Acetobacteraceae bacterium]